ncbi:MAG: putative phosphoesterase [Candidatus Nanohaloarchaea archaeon]|jgi:putative phosphoesterase
MKIGIVSDTHDNVELAEKAVMFFEDQDIDKVVHCGDMIAPFTAEIFNGDFDFYAVRGNNDGEWDLKGAVEEFGSFYNNIAGLEFDGKRIAVYHGTEEEIVEGLVSKDYDYVFRGHTHQRKTEKHDDAVEINPGGIKLPGQEEEFSVAVLDTRTGDIDFRELGP